ncbi:MAG: IPTL-CTERM sorting domain-containing protein [Casimicrobiaceae bacterium]
MMHAQVAKYERDRRGVGLNCASLLIVAFLLTSRAAIAAVFNVAAGDTAGLIAAINTANGNGVANTINLAGGTYNLSAADNSTVAGGANGLPVIVSTLTIIGNGATIARTGAPLFRLFQVGSGTPTSGTAGALTLNDVTLTGGNPGQGGITSSFSGAAINVLSPNSSLALNASTITGNTAAGGGGFTVDGTSASAVVTDSTIANNVASGTSGGFGGGIAVEGSSASLTLTNSAVMNNVAGTMSASIGSEGGGISVDGGGDTITITNSTISGNQSNGGVQGAIAGGIAESGGGDVFTIAGTTISNNSASGTSASGVAQGGAIAAVADGNFTILNSTISGNSASLPAGGDPQGGGIYENGSATFVLSNVTLTNNSARTGGGIFESGFGSITTRNSIIAGNSASAAGPDCSGPVTSQGHNLVGNNAGCTFASTTGDLLNVSPNLGSLADNGGATQTHALNSGSAAIDAGDPGAPGSGGTACEATDQRGTLRPDGPLCDIGAFEGVSTAPPPPPPTTPTKVPTLAEWALYLLSALLAVLGARQLRRRSR